MRRQSAVWSPSGPTGSAARSSQVETGDLAREVPRRARARPAAPRGGRCRSLLGAGGDQGPVGGVAVEHDRLAAREPPAAALALGPGADAVDRVAVAELVERRWCPGSVPAASDASWSSSPRWRGGERGEHGGREERARGRGPGPSPRARPRCRPGRGRARRASSGTSRPVQPERRRAASQTSSVTPTLVVEHRPHVGRRALARRGRPRTVSRRASCSSLKVKSIGPLDLTPASGTDSQCSPPMDFAYTPEDEAFRDRVAGVARRAPARSSWPSGATTTPDARTPPAATATAALMRSMERRKAWQRTLNEGRWAAINWPAEWGGRDATVTQNVIYSEEMAKARTPGIFNANGLWQIGPDDHPLGHRRAEEHLDPEHPQRRRPLVPGVQRARGRQRPRQPAHARRARRRRLRAQRPEDLDLHRPHRQVGPVPRPHRPRRHRARGASTRASPPSSSTWRPTASSAGRSATSPARRCSTRSSSPTPACRSTTASAAKARAGRWPWARSATSGSAPPGLAITMRADLEAMVNLARAENPDALGRPRAAGAHRPGPHPHRVHPAPQLPGAVEDAEGREELARGAAGQAAVEPPRPDPGRAGRRPARPGRRCSARAGPTPSTAASWNRLYVFQRYTSIGAGTTEVQKNIIADRAIRMPKK